MSTKSINILKILLSYFGAIILSIIFAQLGGIIHSVFLNTYCTGGLLIIDFDKGCVAEGFIYFYIFWLAILSFLILKQKTAWSVYLIGTIIFWLFYIYFIFAEELNYIRKEYIGSIIIMLSMFVTGWLLAQIILFIKRKIKKPSII